MWKRKGGREEGRKGKNDRRRWLRSDGNLVGEEHGNGSGEKCWPAAKSEEEGRHGEPVQWGKG